MLTIMMPMLMIHDADMMTTMMTSHDDDGEDDNYDSWCLMREEMF